MNVEAETSWFSQKGALSRAATDSREVPSSISIAGLQCKEVKPSPAQIRTHRSNFNLHGFNSVSLGSELSGLTKG
jgi:hypothetical protein